MSGKISLDDLHQHWVHSREEDTGTEMVFRPATYKFPRARGVRKSFELNPDGTLVERGPAPDDRMQETPGAWKLEDDDTLVFYGKPDDAPRRVMRISSVGRGRLAIKK